MDARNACGGTFPSSAAQRKLVVTGALAIARLALVHDGSQSDDRIVRAGMATLSTPFPQGKGALRALQDR
ncbi:hypothetical protein AKJ09_07650 [Labilithrix luteola]|uniref:Uncharacterized protein n=1 Tax=Labilithrix luteola TaxID=1391654 RepID=A0A0K1Q5Q0_9BACT|nr:hypothetical protein AKJ09_07650 [Labilithrix luteola]